MKRIILFLATNIAVLLVLSIVLNASTSVLLMGPDGVLAGTVDEVLEEGRLTRLYGAPVHLGRVAGRRTLVVGVPDRPETPGSHDV